MVPFYIMTAEIETAFLKSQREVWNVLQGVSSLGV